MRPRKRAGVLAAVAAAAVVCLSSCSSYTGINSLSLPGTVGTGADAYQVKVQLKNADNLVPNTPVLVDDIIVGTVTKVALEGWRPTLTLSLKPDVKLPANATASLGQTSLLGSKHVQLAVPKDEPPQGVLAAGAMISENRTHQYPATEDLLSGVSLLLNGGGLQHFETVTTEFNRALGGRENDTRELLTQLNGFTAGLDKQRNDIVTAMKGLDRFSGTIAPRMEEINTALGQLPDGLRTLDDTTPALRDALMRLGDGSRSLAPFADGGSQELRGVLDELEPVLRRTGDVQQGTIGRALRIVPFVIFPVDTIPYLVRGDYANLNLPVNLTADSLDKGFLTGTPAAGLLDTGATALRDSNGCTNTKPCHSVAPGGGAADKPPAPSGPAAPKESSDKLGGGLVDKPLPGIGG